MTPTMLQFSDCMGNEGGENIGPLTVPFVAVSLCHPTQFRVWVNDFTNFRMQQFAWDSMLQTAISNRTSENGMLVRGCKT